MYRVILINLSPDARSVMISGNEILSAVTPADLRQLLENFAAIDPIENATVETEIRVSVRHENYLLRSANARLILYDVRQRELPGQILPLENIMAELDGSAAAARTQAILQMRSEAEPTPEPSVAPGRVRRRSMLIPLTIIVVLLIAVNREFFPPSTSRFPANFIRATESETKHLHASLTGVYLTGNDPGDHGMVMNGSDDLKFFELGAQAAPRVVYATFVPGRIGSRVFLATDQPGGLIELRSNDVLVYCGENYRRIP